MLKTARILSLSDAFIPISPFMQESKHQDKDHKSKPATLEADGTGVSNIQETRSTESATAQAVQTADAATLAMPEISIQTTQDVAAINDKGVATMLALTPKNLGGLSYKLMTMAGLLDPALSIHRGLFGGLHAQTLQHLHEDGWQLVPIQSVLAWDFEHDTLARPMKEDFRRIWTEPESVVEKHPYEDPLLQTLPTLKHATTLCYHGKDAELCATMLVMESAHWMVVPNETTYKDCPDWGGLIAHCLRDARDQSKPAYTSAFHAKAKIERGAHWDIEWVAFKTPNTLTIRLLIGWQRLKLRLGARKRRSLYLANTPFS